jgi:hypothetical protein
MRPCDSSIDGKNFGRFSALEWCQTSRGRPCAYENPIASASLGAPLPRASVAAVATQCLPACLLGVSQRRCGMSATAAGFAESSHGDPS